MCTILRRGRKMVPLALSVKLGPTIGGHYGKRRIRTGVQVRGDQCAEGISARSDSGDVILSANFVILRVCLQILNLRLDLHQ